MNTQILRRTKSEGHLHYKIKRTKKEVIATNSSFTATKQCKISFQSTFSSTKRNSEKINLLKTKPQTRRKSSCHQEKYKEKSCSMLLAIVFLFVLTHSFRLAFKFYEVLIPNTAEQFERCLRVNRLVDLVSYFIFIVKFNE